MALKRGGIAPNAPAASTTRPSQGLISGGFSASIGAWIQKPFSRGTSPCSRISIPLFASNNVRSNSMRLAQTKEATREFVALLESHLTTIHPDYKRSRHAKGIRYEFIREIGDGLYAIHSVLCMRGRYYHCFCLSEHLGHVGPTLYSPFTIGGRCDHNYSITRACHGDLGLSPVDPVTPFRMSDSHQFRTGADKIVRRCTSEAEARLLPFYQSVWKQTRPVLQEMLDYIAATPADRLASTAATYPGPPS